MLRRRTRKILTKYIARYGPNRYGPRGWPAGAEGLDVRGVDTRMRELAREVESGGVLDRARLANTLREAAGVVDFVAAESSKTITKIDAKHGEVFRTAAIISGEHYSAYMRRLTVYQHLQDAERLSTSLRSLAKTFDRRRWRANLFGRNS